MDGDDADDADGVRDADDADGRRDADDADGVRDDVEESNATGRARVGVALLAFGVALVGDAVAGGAIAERLGSRATVAGVGLLAGAAGVALLLAGDDEAGVVVPVVDASDADES